MTDSSIIQQARDVLKKWREEASSKGQWAHDDLGGMSWTVWANGSDPYDADVIHVDSGTDAALIVGTAGNPDLLDAIDGLLRLAYEWKHGAPGKNIQLVRQGEHIAAAIIAAEERMNA